jgi:toxin HigB-1
MPNDVQQVGRRKLRMLNNSQGLVDLRIPPSKKPEKLSGQMADFYSIRINNQFRTEIRLDDGNANEVTIIDYHK